MNKRNIMNSYYKNIPDETLLVWSKEVKSWYGVDCTDVALLRKAAAWLPDDCVDGEPYDEVFLRKGDVWTDYPDTADREALAVYIRNEIKKLHCEKGPAMLGEDGFKSYYLNGEKVDPEVIVNLWLERGVFCYFDDKTQTLNFE